MTKYVYWNSNDNDCVKIFHFLSKNDEDATIIPLIDENEVDRIIQPSNGLETRVYERIANSDLVIFCTHGTKDTIMKYQKREKFKDSEVVLVDEDNIDILKGKNVIALCCSTAKRFGRKCIDDDICKSYIGFEGPIYYDTDKHVSDQKKHQIYVAYKKAFCKALKYGIEKNVSALEFKNYLALQMKKMTVEAALESDNGAIYSIYSTTLDGLVALGNEAEKIFA